MTAPPFERIAIVGLGLIGGSVALAARRRWPTLDITVCDPAPITAEAVTQGLAQRLAEPEALPPVDLIVIATPVQSVPSVLATLGRSNTRAVVTDVSSTKRVVMAAARQTGLTFVGGHPVAGSEQGGLASARADLFDGKAWLLVSPAAAVATTEGPAPDPAHEAMLTTFVSALGARPSWTDAVTHDKVMAHVSHAPQVISTALMAASADAVGPEGVAWSGKGFADMTRLASSPSDIWQGILDTNADFIADALQALAAKLPTSSEALMDAPSVKALFERARELREATKR
jgi:prephenate dehydrogenase